MLVPTTEIGSHLKRELERQFFKRFNNIEKVHLLVIATICYDKESHLTDVMLK